MKVLIIQENGRHEENRNFRECFCLKRSLEKLSCDVEIWGKGHENFSQSLDFDNYDLVINLENYDTVGWVPDLSPYSKCVKMLWSIDAHCRGIEPYRQTYYSGKYDVILQAIKDYVDEDSVWFPNCYDDSLINYRKNIKKEVPIGFCGSLLNRGQLLNFLKEQYNLQPDIWVLGSKMVDKINSYWIHFNINLANDINYRSFETIGSGTVLLTNRNSQYEELGFIDEVNCLMYGSMEELQEKLKNYIGKTEKLQKISKQGLELAKSHTYDKRAQTLLEIYERFKK